MATLPCKSEVQQHEQHGCAGHAHYSGVGVLPGVVVPAPHGALDSQAQWPIRTLAAAYVVRDGEVLVRDGMWGRHLGR